MIHSMSGGVLADGTVYTFAKVEAAGSPRWYLAPFSVSAGERVVVPFGEGEAEGVVLKTENCTRQTAPVPVNRAREIIRKCVSS